MSGDINTSLGNVIIMCLMMYAYCQEKKFRLQLINDGDDCVLICERGFVSQLKDVPTWFAQLGFVMEVEEPVYEIEKIVFCQCQPVFVNDSYRIVRDPRTCLDKDLCIVKPIQHRKDWMFYRRAIAQSGLCLAGDLPIYNEFYSMLERGTTKADCVRTNTNSRRRGVRDARLDTGLEYLSVRMERKCQQPSPESRASFYFAFDIPPDYQIAIENQYSRQNLEWSEYTNVPRFGNLIAEL
jgi:hypothetical protein